MIPITVRLANGQVDCHITNRLSGLSWRTVVPGGYASASFRLQAPIDFTSPMLLPFTRVYIYDGRSGDTVWEGRLAMPGRSADENGQVWAMTATGPSAHALDQNAPLIYIDRRLDEWRRSTLEANVMPAAATVSVGNHPDTSTVDAVVNQAGPGVPVTTGSLVGALYDGFQDSGMEIGAIGYAWDTGFTSGQWNTELVLGTFPTYLSILNSVPADVAGGNYTAWVTDTFAGGMDIASLRLRRVSGGAATVAGDTTWAAFSNIRILGRRLTKDGISVAGAAGMGASSIYVRASWVVADLLGRMLPQYDGPNADLSAADTVDIDQFAYRDPANPNEVLDDLMKLQANTFWAAWESNGELDGRYRFEWVNWDTEPRYEASVEDGFDSPAPTFELYDRVTVRYRDWRGKTRTYTRFQDVEALTMAGITREHYEDLGDELGSTTNAAAVAANFLDDHKAAISSGTVTLSRPIRDTINACWVYPWQIVPGELIAVRGIEASQEVTGEAARDGMTVFRIVAVEPNSDGEATLELDMFTPSDARELSQIAMRRNRKR